ncbi:ATP-binding protein [Enhygromyxa salina]|uniref:histidine kinase n=1 Tax=Enhygromyxa salina TaxID=215803 RepID=A0A2S9YT00_9BACT|nr:ATP-binding protein [Enhygromyxa salina]PRQ08162.1 Blue-light-activated protein [Enhygromyxa salina]
MKSAAMKAAWYEQVFEATSNAMFIYTLDGKLVDVNPAACALHGYTREQMLGMAPADFIAPESIHVFDAFREALANGREYRGEAQGLRADGGRFDVEVYGVGIRLGDELFACSSLTDITERVQLRRELAEAVRMDALGRLAGGIAHDFNNMLSVIMCNADLGRTADDPRDVARSFDEILEAAERARQLTTQLLSFSRNRAIRRGRVDLDDVARAVLPLIETLLPDTITLTSQVRSGPHFVDGEASPLEQIIVNLVLNARDALPSGGHIRLETRARVLDATSHAELPPGPYVELIVEDDGIGMDAATRSRIFEPFFTTKQSQGTGLGLASAYGIVRQYGGGIVVYSELGRGTTFRVFFPLSTDQVERVDTAPALDVDHGQTALSGMTVLVVDDEQLVGQVVVRAAKQFGATAMCTTVEAAPALLDRTGAGLLIINVLMPGQSGIELYEALLETHPELRVLYLSGYSADHLSRGGLLDPDIEVLSKPFSTAELISAIARAGATKRTT